MSPSFRQVVERRLWSELLMLDLNGGLIGYNNCHRRHSVQIQRLIANLLKIEALLDWPILVSDFREVKGCVQTATDQIEETEMPGFQTKFIRVVMVPIRERRAQEARHVVTRETGHSTSADPQMTLIAREEAKSTVASRPGLIPIHPL